MGTQIQYVPIYHVMVIASKCNLPRWRSIWPGNTKIMHISANRSTAEVRESISRSGNSLELLQSKMAANM